MSTVLELENKRVKMVQPLIGYIDGQEVTVEIGEYGTEFAENYLKKVIKNRAINSANVKRLVNDMNQGRYMFNGDAFRFDRHGNAADGAHTAQSIIESGKSIVRLVVRGLDPAAFHTIDRGARRKLSDDLCIDGVDYSREVAATARLAFFLETKPGQQPGYKDTTDSEVLLYVKANLKIIEYAKLHAIKEKSILGPSVVAAFHFIFSKKDKTLADQFIDQLLTGAAIEKETGVFLLRKILVDNLGAKKRLRKTHILALIIKAWNGARQQIPVRQLKYARRGKQAERFPEII
jgi:hypothetical protein